MGKAKALLVTALLVLLQGDLTSQVLQSDETTVVTVDSTSLRFSPSSVTVTEGDTVRFFWSGQALAHNAVEENGVFDTGEPQRAVDVSFTFERGMNGTYTYVCEPHEAVGMVGQIVVEPAAEVEAEPEAPVASENTPFLPASMMTLAFVLAFALRRLQGNG
jgi:plastocyanin